LIQVIFILNGDSSKGSLNKPPVRPVDLLIDGA
jgi:hypothetical protein